MSERVRMKAKKYFIILMMLVLFASNNVFLAKAEEIVVANDRSLDIFDVQKQDTISITGLSGILYKSSEVKSASISIKTLLDFVAVSLNLVKVGTDSVILFKFSVQDDFEEFFEYKIYDVKISEKRFSLECRFFSNENYEGYLTVKDCSMAENNYSDIGDDCLVKFEIKKKQTYAADGSTVEKDFLFCNHENPVLIKEETNSTIFKKLAEFENKPVYSKIEIINASPDVTVIEFFQIGSKCFFDYNLVSDGIKEVSEATYGALTIQWEKPISINTTGGYTIKRSRGGNLEKIYNFSSSNLNRLADASLSVGKTYEYEVACYNDIASAVPKLIVKYDKFYAKTKEPNIALTITIVCSCIFACVVFALVYIYKFDILKVLKQSKKK